VGGSPHAGEGQSEQYGVLMLLTILVILVIVALAVFIVRRVA
jgi:hypothetical protein